MKRYLHRLLPQLIGLPAAAVLAWFVVTHPPHSGNGAMLGASTICFWAVWGFCVAYLIGAATVSEEVRRK